MNSVAFTAPERASDLLDRRQFFSSLFPRRDAFIWKTYEQERWQKATGPLLDAQILGVVSDEGRGLFRGCYWSHKTRHAVFDLDIQSRYHKAAELEKLQAHLAAVGLYAIPYRSSESGGWHLYLPFDEWEESDEVNQTLKTWLKSLEYEITSGQLEIFPSGNALRLPLQKGFAWLNSDGSIKVRREEIREDEALASFLQDFEENSRNWDAAKRLIESQISSAGSRAGAGVQEHEKVISLAGFDDLFKKGKIQETWDKGREYWLNGLTAKGQRHDAVLAVGHYLWYGDPSESVPAYPGRRNDETRARLIEAWLRKKHNGFCRHINTEQWKEIEAQIWRAVFWRREKGFQVYQAYPLTDRLLRRLLEVYKKTGQLFEIDRMAEANKKREKSARVRIKNAFQKCLQSGRQVTRNGLAEMAGCSPNTVSRHQDLWVLTTGSGVYNRGVWGVPSALPASGSCTEPVAVLTKILTVQALGFENKEKSENPFSSEADSGDLGVWGSMERKIALSSKTSEVAPLAICLANSQPESTQHQDRALTGCCASLDAGTLALRYSGRGADGHGGISFIFRAHAARKGCYTVSVTEYGIKEKAGATSEVGALPCFGARGKFGKRILDTTNYKFLTTDKPGYSSSLADEFSLISNIANSLDRSEKRIRRSFKTNPSGELAESKSLALACSWRFSDDLPEPQKPSGIKSSGPTDLINASTARLSVKRPTLRLRGPPM